jgi:histidinol phosphatase-like enzyme (inositol monophosphatase family)
MSDHPSYRDLMQFAADAAYNAGVAVETKADDTPVTRADKEAELLLRELIETHHPTHSILGEEHGSVSRDPDWQWIVDPIDGTKSFIRGVPLYATLVGLEHRGRPVVGAVALPATGELFVAALGEGCWWNGRRARASDVTSLKDAAVMCSSVRDAQRRSDAYDRLASAARIERTWGDAYGYMLVATGRADVMLDPIINVWDICAVAPILEEAGAVWGDWTGEKSIRRPDFFAAAPGIEGEVLAVLRSEKRR